MEREKVVEGKEVMEGGEGICVPFSTQKELISASVETRGLDSVRATIPEKENASSAATSPSAALASLTYTLQITGTVAR